MALFGGSRDVSLIRKINRELMGDIITQQASFYKYKLEETSVNLYGEAAGSKFYDGPFLFNCLIQRENQSYPEGDEGIGFGQGIEFRFLRADLVDANVVAEVGDIILYQEKYYGVDSVVANQYFVGKNPDYPNNINPLNPGLENFGGNHSVICTTYYVPADKVNISPYKERF
jgi:hypothetical protein